MYIVNIDVYVGRGLVVMDGPHGNFRHLVSPYGSDCDVYKFMFAMIKGQVKRKSSDVLK